MNDNGKLEIPKLNFDRNGALLIQPSTTSSQTDFDFLVGKWRLKHEKLRSPLAGCKDWDEFERTAEDFRILEGIGHMDVGQAIFDGLPWKGRTIQVFNKKPNFGAFTGWRATPAGRFQRQTVHHDVSPGCAQLRAPYPEPSLFARQRQNLGVELA